VGGPALAGGFNNHDGLIIDVYYHEKGWKRKAKLSPSAGGTVADGRRQHLEILLDFHPHPLYKCTVPCDLQSAVRVRDRLDKDILKCTGGRHVLKESGGFFLSVIVFIRLSHNS